MGHVRGPAVSFTRKTSPAAQEVHQDRCAVSSLKTNTAASDYDHILGYRHTMRGVQKWCSKVKPEIEMKCFVNKGVNLIDIYGKF